MEMEFLFNIVHVQNGNKHFISWKNLLLCLVSMQFFLGTIQIYSCEFLFQPIFSDFIFNLHFTAFAWCLIGVSANTRYKNRIKSNTWLNWMISKACLPIKMMYSIIISGSFMDGKKILYGGAVDALIVDWNGLDRWMDWLIDWINKNLRIEGSKRERNKRHRDIWCENEWNQGGEIFVVVVSLLPHFSHVYLSNIYYLLN